jgi:NADPH-dependent 7-cyano-7-deazaguanine reductase QueF
MDQDLINIKEVVTFIARKENRKGEIEQLLERAMEKLEEFNSEQILEFVNRYRRRGSYDD